MNNNFETQSIFTMFKEVIPESMQAKEKITTAAKKGKATKVTTNTSNAKVKANEEVLVPLPVTILYARESRILELHHFTSDDVTYKISMKNKGGNKEPINVSLEDLKEESETCCSENSCCEENEYEVLEEQSDDANLDIDIIINNNNNTLDIISEDEKVQTEAAETKIQEETDDVPKVTLETIRRRIVLDWPELTKERTKMDYDKKNNIVVPIVYSGTKGAVRAI